MKRSRPIVNKKAEKKIGRPRSVSDDDPAPAVAVRLPPGIAAHVDRLAADSGKKRSEVIRDLVAEAIAGRAEDGMKSTKRKPKTSNSA